MRRLFYSLVVLGGVMLSVVACSSPTNVKVVAPSWANVTAEQLFTLTPINATFYQDRYSTVYDVVLFNPKNEKLSFRWFGPD